jgi:hypothetical protein
MDTILYNADSSEVPIITAVSSSLLRVELTI